MKKALITGIAGQDGSYLAEQLLAKGYKVDGIVRRSSQSTNSRIAHLIGNPNLTLHYGDLLDTGSLARILSCVLPDEIYHLAAQSHVWVSFQTPGYSIESVMAGTVNLLETYRMYCPSARYYQASSSEMYGEVLEMPQKETTPFNPRSPYGCAKAGAHYLVKNYQAAYGLHASCGILFNHECLTEETPILFRKNGWIDIAEIQELVPHRDDPRRCKKYQTEPDNLEIFDGGAWSRVTLATATWNGGEKEVYRVEARGGLYCATGDHKSFKVGRQEIETKELKSGDNLQLYDLPVTTESACISSEEAEFLGLMVGDGYVSPDGGSARFTNMDETLLSRASELFCKLTGGKARLDYTKTSGFTGEVVPSVELSGASNWFSFWRSELYNERRMKKVPKRVLNAPVAVQKKFLQGYNAADGLQSNTCNDEFKCWVTNSPVLAAGLWYLGENQNLRVAMNWDKKGYFRLNVGSKYPKKGQHLLKELAEVKTCEKIAHTGWLFDLATESGTFSAGVGRTWVHNSPRRAEEFVTRKITRGIARIMAGKQRHLWLGNLDAKRDWGYAPEYTDAMWRMLQQPRPDDYVIATGKTYSIREFLNRAFDLVELSVPKYVLGDPTLYRASEVDLLLGDATKAKQVLGWEPQTTLDQLVEKMVTHDLQLEGLI